MKRTRAYALIEVVAIVAVIALLIGLLVPALTKQRQMKVGIQCLSNLKQAGLALKVYEGNSFTPYLRQGSLAYSNDTQAWLYFQEMSNELRTATILMCPDDRERVGNVVSNFNLGQRMDARSLAAHSNNAVSYFINVDTDETRPQALLSGDRHMAPNAKSPAFSTKVAGRATFVQPGAEWSTVAPTAMHGGEGNVLLGDGSVNQMNNWALGNQMRLSDQTYGTNTSRLLFPQ